MDNDSQQQLRKMITDTLGLVETTPLVKELKNASNTNIQLAEKYEEAVAGVEQLDGMEEVRKAYRALSEALETLTANEIERQQNASAKQIVPKLVEVINHEGYHFYKSHQDLVVKILDGGIIPESELKEVNRSLKSYTNTSVSYSVKFGVNSLNLTIPVDEINELKRAVIVALMVDLEKIYEGTSIIVNTFLVDKEYGTVKLERSNDEWKVSRDDEESIPLSLEKTIYKFKLGIPRFSPESV